MGFFQSKSGPGFHPGLICETMSCRSGGVADLADHLDQPVDDALELALVVAFGHHPDYRFGARRADHQSALAQQLRFGIGDQWEARLETDGAIQVRSESEAPAAEGFGRVPVWGFARVEASNHPGVAVGQRFYGYWPMSTHLTVTPKVGKAGFADAAPGKDLNGFFSEDVKRR